MAGLIEFYFKLIFYSSDVWNMWNNVWDVEYVKSVEIRIIIKKNAPSARPWPVFKMSFSFN